MSLAEALNLIYTEGSKDSQLKKTRIKKRIKKESKRHGWEDSILKTLDKEWQWRICNARLSLGYKDWKGWGFREPRAGRIPFDYPWWDGTPVKKLLLLGEQGVGDEILFASMFNELQYLVEDLTIDCEPRLYKIFKRSFPNITFLPREHYDHKTTDSHFDAMYLMGDLLPLLRRNVKSFPGEPYLKPDPDLVKKYKPFKGLNGVSWVGRQGRVEEIKMYGDLSIQYDEESSLPEPPFDLKDDFDDLFAFIYNLEKVVCVPTTVAHIAGSMGVPCDVIMPKTGEDHGGFDDCNNALHWRWSQGFNHGTKMLFHNSVEIYPNVKGY